MKARIAVAALVSALPLWSQAGITISTQSLPNGQVGVPYSELIEVQNGTPPYLFSVSSGTLPPGLTLGLLTGRISGTPQVAGNFAFAVRAVDLTLRAATASLSIGIVPAQGPTPVRIMSTSLPNGAVGAAYSAAVSASGGTQPYVWTASGLPPGLSIVAGTGEIRGTPTAAGSFGSTVTVTDNAGSADSRPFTITIEASVLIISPASLPNGTVGVSYRAVLTVTGGTSPYRWSLTSGSLPGGLSFADGEIAGVPSNAGAQDFTIQATDATNASGAQNYRVTIAPPVSIATASLPDATAGRAYAADLSASGGLAPYGWSIASGALPAGLNLAAGRISGTPTQVGTSSFTVVVRDSTGSSASQTLTIAVRSALAIATDSLPGGTEGAAYSASLSATDAVGQVTWSVSQGSLPPGLSLTGSQIGGTASAAGSYSFTIQAADAAGGSVTRPYSVTIAAPLVLNAVSLPNGVVGQDYSADIAASGGTPPYTFSVVSGSLPGGLSLNDRNGRITGKPTAAGSFTFIVEVRDRNSAAARQSFTIVVLAPLTISTGSLPGGTVGSAYTARLEASGGVPPYTWSVISGSLPSGLSLSGSGDISGMPSANGNSSFTVRVADSGGASATANLTIAISSSLSITTTSLPGGVAGTPYSASLGASGGAPPYSWSIANGSLPQGLALDGATGGIAGTPGAPGNASFTVQVADRGGARATASLTISIAAPLTITTGALADALQGSGYSAILTASGGTPPYRWSVAGGLPPGLDLNPSGEIAGTPNSAGTFNFTLGVTDSAAATASKSLSITVASLTPPLEMRTTVLPGGSVGNPYSTVLTGFGGNQPYKWSIAEGSLPPGLALNGISGEIGGRPTAGGSFRFTVRLEDGKDTVTRQFTIAVTSRLSIGGNDRLPEAAMGTAYTYTLSAADGTQPYRWSIISGALPGGISLDGASGVISGTATAPGNFNFTAQVTDAASLTASKALTLAVVQNLTITSTPPLPAAAVGTAYSQALAALAGSPPYRWSVSSGSLPGGLTLNATTGVLSGSPTGAGSFNFTIRVADSASGSASKAFTMTVVAALTVTTASLPNGTAGAPYLENLAALAGTSPYSWSITSGTLPAGISLDAGSGRISGTPSSAGRSDFTAQVRDAVGATASKALSITISQTLSISTTTLPEATAGVSYSQRLSVSGGSAPFTWAVTAGSLPGGLSLDSANGTIAGTTTAPGEHQFTIQVTDASRANTSLPLTLRVMLAAMPEVTFSGLPASAAPLEQPRVGVALRRPMAVALTGQLVLSFEPDAAVASDDPSIQFSTGGRTVNFSIPANATDASFPTAPALQTGSVAGTITVEARLTAGGIDATPVPAPKWTIRVNRTAPVVRSVRLVRTGAGVEVWVTGLSPSRELTQATFRFTPAIEVTVQLGDAARQWYQDSASHLFGSQFTLVQPFTVQGGGEITSVSVTLTNGQGTSPPVF